MDPFRRDAVRGAYDAVATGYADLFGDDLDRLPLDRAVLDKVVASGGRSRGRALDLGCGPGQVGRYLSQRELRVVGADLSLRMLALATGHIGNRAVCADMRALPFREASFGVVTAWYSLHHVPRADLAMTIDQVKHVLEPGGVFAIATHLGDGEIYADELLGQRVERFGATLYGRSELENVLREHGFRIDAARERGPLPHEYESRRIYIRARRA